MPLYSTYKLHDEDLSGDVITRIFAKYLSQRGLQNFAEAYEMTHVDFSKYTTCNQQLIEELFTAKKIKQDLLQFMLQENNTKSIQQRYQTLRTHLMKLHNIRFEILGGLHCHELALRMLQNLQIGSGRPRPNEDEEYFLEATSAINHSIPIPSHLIIANEEVIDTALIQNCCTLSRLIMDRRYKSFETTTRHKISD